MIISENDFWRPIPTLQKCIYVCNICVVHENMVRLMLWVQKKRQQNELLQSLASYYISNWTLALEVNNALQSKSVWSATSRFSSNILYIVVCILVLWTTKPTSDYNQHLNKRVSNCLLTEMMELFFGIIKIRTNNPKTGKVVNLICMLYWLMPSRVVTCTCKTIFSPLWPLPGWAGFRLASKHWQVFSNRLSDLLIRKYFSKDCLTAVMNMMALWFIKS